MGKCALRALVLAIASFSVPLMLIGLAAALSSWFNLYSNALSDLGHAIKSNVAPLFNTGLSLGGVLMILFAVKYVEAFSRVIALLVVIAGYALVLVGVFDEVYGALHFVVSVLFFVSILLLVLGYGLVLRDPRIVVLASILVSLNIVVWTLHFAIRVPRGAAIPELISIFTAIPFYLHLARKSASTLCREK
ncbi:MAG: DUF998 domain-containing protein [Desulfurococcaceae archaeon]